MNEITRNQTRYFLVLGCNDSSSATRKTELCQLKNLEECNKLEKNKFAIPPFPWQTYNPDLHSATLSPFSLLSL
ncbi:hypothetical protein ACTXT7_015807 [Hymenolepis weldensis]